MITVRIKLFAIHAQQAGTDAVSVELPEGAVARDALDAVAARFPKVFPGKRQAAVAVNLAYVPIDTLLNDGDEVALIPPVSGG